MKPISNINERNNLVTEWTFLNRVFVWMGIGLGITALISYIVYVTPSLTALLITGTGLTWLGYLIMFAPVGFVLLMSFGFNRLSYISLVILYITYAAIMGASLSFIFMVFTNESIYRTFIIAALMFGIMGAAGYTTKTDLTKMGSILLMALIGIIIASLINIFMKSDSLSYIISFISVILFCGLTAWDIQKLKNLEEETIPDAESKSKLGIRGALTLYLDFVNLFLSILNFTGKRKRN